jgi:hypothetical protein
VHLDVLATWSVRRWAVALAGAVAITLVIGLPTDVVPNPVFGRPVPVTWWSYPVLAVTAVLGGLLVGTYVREPAPSDDDGGSDDDVTGPPSRLGGAGGLLSFFAVGCPVCNKVVLLALGTTGARRWFEPIQPYLAVASIALLVVALRARLGSATSCALPRGGRTLPGTSVADPLDARR